MQMVCSAFVSKTYSSVQWLSMVWLVKICIVEINLYSLNLYNWWNLSDCAGWFRLKLFDKSDIMLIQEITTIHLSLKFLCFSSVLFNNKLVHNTVQYQYTITFPQITNLKSFNLWIGNYLCLATTVQYFVLYTEQKSVLLMADSSLSLMSQYKARFLQVYVPIILNSFSPSGNPQAFDCCPCPGSWVFDTKSLLRVENLNPVKVGWEIWAQRVWNLQKRWYFLFF